MKTWQAFRALLREMPRFYADKFDRWLADVHSPRDGDPQQRCRNCRKPWPCETFMDARDRMYERARTRGTEARRG